LTNIALGNNIAKLFDSLSAAGAFFICGNKSFTPPVSGQCKVFLKEKELLK
jgi:hypothetical protein